MFQSSAHLVLVSLFAAFLMIAFAVVSTGAREQAKRKDRPGAPVRIESQRAAYYEWMARHDGHRRNFD